MEAKIFLGLIVILVLLVAGCGETLQQLIPNPSASTGQTVGRGVAVSFAEGLPRTSLRLGQDFTVKVNLKNYMPNEVNGEVSIEDYAGESIGAIPERKEVERFEIDAAEGRSYEETGITMGTYAYPREGMLTSSTIVAKAEYNVDYEAKDIQLRVCGENMQRECNRVGTSSSAVNIYRGDAMNAPIFVTSVIQESYASEGKTEVYLKIRVQDSGGENGWINNKENEIRDFKVSAMGYGNFECNEGEDLILKFKPGKTRDKEVECKMTFNVNKGEEVFDVPVEISFSYPYVSQSKLYLELKREETSEEDLEF